ncbi:MAG: transposase [Myxococcales bacterium]|nr:transposase [Myxococcales bacterium]
MKGEKRAGRSQGGQAQEQLALFQEKKRGGKRRGAGRPPKGRRSSSPHKVRPFHHARFPVHVVLRVIDEVGSLRRHCAYRAIREATFTTARRENFRIVHISLQRNHVHLIVEADHKEALSSGMQGFQISAAKHLNAEISKGRPGPRRRGTVFVDRYYAVPITSPRQARHALSYVMGNWRKHEEDRIPGFSEWKVDWYSSGPVFPDWDEYGDQSFLMPYPPNYDPLLVYRPRTWLLREGWKKSGPISYRAVPSAS